MKNNELEGIIAILKAHFNKKKIKWTDLEKEARDRLIYYLFCTGYTPTRIVYYLMDTFGISKKQGWVWLRDARKDAIPEEEEYREKALQIQLERLNDIVANGSDKAKIAALDQINKLLGLYKEKVEIETDNDIKFTFN